MASTKDECGRGRSAEKDHHFGRILWTLTGFSAVTTLFRWSIGADEPIIDWLGGGALHSGTLPSFQFGLDFGASMKNIEIVSTNS